MSLSKVAAIAFVAAAMPLASGADLSGRIELRTPEGRPVPAAEAQNGVVSFEPAAGAATRPGTFEMRTRNKRFEPRVLAVTVGSTVEFPNADPILHNVFSVSRPNDFDVGLYGEGTSRSHVFREAGVVRVFCNVHHEMVAHVLVLETPHFVRPDADGAFRLSGLPAGPGRLTVWHERTEPWTRDVALPVAEPLRVELEVSGRRVPRHLNKLGRPYRQPDGERYD